MYSRHLFITYYFWVILPLPLLQLVSLALTHKTCNKLCIFSLSKILSIPLHNTPKEQSKPSKLVTQPGENEFSPKNTRLECKGTNSHSHSSIYRNVMSGYILRLRLSPEYPYIIVIQKIITTSSFPFFFFRFSFLVLVEPLLEHAFLFVLSQRIFISLFFSFLNSCDSWTKSWDQIWIDI